jgi:hypothetical protein
MIFNKYCISEASNCASSQKDYIDDLTDIFINQQNKFGSKKKSSHVISK